MDETIDYLLAGDPAIRWQTLRDVIGAPADEVAAARALVATEGWGRALLDRQDADGRWDGGTYRPGWADEERPFFDAWTATHFSLQSLMQFGVDPDDPRVVAAIAKVRESVRWEHDGEPYFDGEVEPCINGVALAITAYFGQDGSTIADTIMRTRQADGGWNCWFEDEPGPSSFHSTICALEGLWAWEQVSGSDETRDVRIAGEEYLLERSLLRRKRDGALVDPRFTMASYPDRWYYDVLRALDYFRQTRPADDPRFAEAVALLRSKRLPHGLWPLELTHEGPTLFDMRDEGEGFPSRWVTLRALRVLTWADAAH